MWRRLPIWKGLSSNHFRTARSIVISTQSRQFQRPAESHSTAWRHRNCNVDTNVRQMSLMSTLSMSAPASIGAIVMSVSESCVDYDDVLFPSSRVKLTLAVLSSYASVYAAFSLRDILRTQWKPASQLHPVLSRVRGRETSMVQGRDARLVAMDCKRSRSSGARSDKPKRDENTPQLSKKGWKRSETENAGAVNANK